MSLCIMLEQHFILTEKQHFVLYILEGVTLYYARGQTFTILIGVDLANILKDVSLIRVLVDIGSTKDTSI